MASPNAGCARAETSRKTLATVPQTSTVPNTFLAIGRMRSIMTLLPTASGESVIGRATQALLRAFATDRELAPLRKPVDPLCPGVGRRQLHRAVGPPPEQAGCQG